MMFVPIETEPVQAAKWVHDSPERVEEFLEMLTKHSFKFTFDFDTDIIGDPEVEVNVWRGNDIIKTVRNMHWLLIHANGSLETMTDTSFIKTYRVA